MPIFEYVCQDCKKRFEVLVYGSTKVLCPLCHGTNLNQQVSVFAVVNSKPERACAAAAGCGGMCGASPSAGGCCPLD